MSAEAREAGFVAALEGEGAAGVFVGRSETAAAGVMMIPVREAGILTNIEGVDEASKTPGVEEIVITAKPGEKLVPPPEGSGYPGFIFARGESSQSVEKALRIAHAKINFVLAPVLPVV